MIYLTFFQPLWKEDSSSDPIMVDALKIKQNNLTKAPENQQLYPNNVLSVEEEFTEEINVQHVIPYVISIIKRSLQCPLPIEISSKLDK